MQQFKDWVKSQFNRIYNKRVSPVPLGLFRIIYGISVLIEIVHLFYFRQLFMDPIPFLEPYPYPAGVLLVLWGIAILFLTVGYKVKPAAVANYVFSVLFLGYGSEVFGYEWHVDSLILSGALLLLFMPTDRALSLQLWLERRSGVLNSKPTVRFIYPVLLMLLIGGVYFDSIFWKFTSDMYLSGLALWAPASLPANVYLDIQWLLDMEYLIYAASATVLFYETLFLFLVWFKPWRILLITLGVIFHIAIGIAFPLPAFGLIMVGFLLGGMPTDVYAAIYRWFTGNQFQVHYETDELQIAEKYDSSGRTYQQSVIPAGFQKKFITGYLVFWLASLFVIHFSSPFYTTYLGDRDSFWENTHKAGWLYKELVYPFTGFSSHGLYTDTHFSDYDYQIKLVYLDEEREETLPVIRDNGMAGIYNVGRNHIYWTFRTAGPGTPRELMEERLGRFILFWMHQNDVDMDNAVVNIFKRPQKVSMTDFSKGRLHENMSGEWKLAGKFLVDDGEFKYEWHDKDLR